MISDELYLKIIDFFTNTPPKSDDDVHAFAEAENIDAHDLEQAIYDILATFLAGGKYNSNDTEAKIDPKELAMGAKVELEHLDADANPVILKALAERISKDHLVELFKYYTYLKKMESEGKAEEGKAGESDEEIIASVINNVRM